MVVTQDGGGLLAPSNPVIGVQSSGSRCINLFTNNIPTILSLLPMYTGTLEWPCDTIYIHRER